ncbi:MAG: hypothetical protein FWG69_02070 [Oscillospiraceae bacterium]|nr:hypothetical protein [Oscillospiraceae bacterium]
MKYAASTAATVGSSMKSSVEVCEMKKNLSGFERQLCDIQGRLFEKSLEKNLNSAAFIQAFMNSKTCEFLDMPYDRLQWAGEEYILENLQEETVLTQNKMTYDKEVLFWIGYTYRYWHFLTGESSKAIYIQADAKRMNECYLGFHTLDVAMAIEDLKEIYIQENKD